MITVLSVLHFSTFGGPHNRTAEVARLLRPQGVNTIVAIPEEPGTAYERLLSRGLEVYRIPMQRIRRTTDLRTQFRTIRQAGPSIQALRMLIRDRGVDVVALNALNAPHLGLAGRLERRPQVWEIIDTFPHPVIKHAFMPFVRRWSDAILATGAAVAAQHPGTLRFGERLFYFYPCVDMHRFTRTAAKSFEARRLLGLPSEAPVVGTVGNLNPMKGHATFIRAAAQVLRQCPSARFVILGASYTQYPGYWESMLQLAGRSGLELGRNLVVRDPLGDVSSLSQAFDVFWMTSEPRSEGIPTAIGEAMALRTPVVAGAVGAIDECVVDKVTGFVVPAADPMSMVEPTLLLLRDSGLRELMGAAGRSRAAETFDGRLGAAQHLRAYEMAMKHHASVHATSR